MMFEIKFFGWIRHEVGIPKLLMSERTVIEAFEEIMRCYPHVDKSDLLQSILFINKKPAVGNQRLFIMLKAGDELAVLSPMSGG